MPVNSKIFAVCAAAMMVSSAFALTPTEKKVEKERISAEYKSAKEQCKALKGNAQDVCELQAKGHEKVALAQLDYKAEANESNRHKLAKTQADTAYDIAKEQCDDRTGNDKDVCKKDAQAAHVKALEVAKMAEVRNDPAAKPSDMANARKDASDKTREADYKAVKERCDALNGDAKDACTTDAKRRFGQ